MTFRKVETCIWNDEKFSKLSHDSQLCFLFILTHPAMTSLGAMRATIAGLAAELKYSEKQFRAAINAAASMIVVDETACFIWLPNFLKYNRPENSNVVKHYRNAAEALPECELKAELIARTREFLKDFPESFQKAFEEVFPEPLHKPYSKPSDKPFTEPCTEPSPEPSRNGMPNQEPEPEQEPKQERERESGGSPLPHDFSLTEELRKDAAEIGIIS